SARPSAGRRPGSEKGAEAGTDAPKLRGGGGGARRIGCPTPVSGARAGAADPLHTPALTTCRPDVAPLDPAASRRLKRRCLRRLSSISGRQTSAVSRNRISQCQIKFDRLYKYDIAR